MLVLSRKKDDEILFPQLDITIKVVDTGSQTVRIGIDAPKEVRILRGELDANPAPNTTKPPKPTQPNPTQPNRPLSGYAISNKTISQKAILDQIDQANLAIHLAQNQLRQGLSSHAEKALQNAIECLCLLESNLVSYPSDPATIHEPIGATNDPKSRESVAPELATVREARSSYRTSKVSSSATSAKKPQVTVEAKPQTALAIACAQRRLELIESTFRKAGFQVVVDRQVPTTTETAARESKGTGHVDFSTC